MIAYSIIGLIMILSASSIAAVLRYQKPSNYFFIRQAISLVFGYIIGFAIMNVPTKSYRYFSRILMYVMMALLALVLVLGVIRGGAKGWYKVGRFNFQPLEFMKLVMIIYMAGYYNKIVGNRNAKFINVMWPIVLVIITFVLVAMQPDFGGAFIIAFIAGLIFFSVPLAKKQKKFILKYGTYGLILLAFILLIFGKSLLHTYQTSRFNFLNPCTRYSEESGYQVCNSYIAIHNGGLWGVGLGNSTQKYLYLPEAHTDFIFAIIAEELGLIFAIFIVIGYFGILFVILMIAKDATSLRNSILCYGIFAYLFAHIAINLLGILGLIPLTGVPLPFLSYGGSYTLNLIISLFIVQRVNIENAEEKAKNKIKNL
jgi:cell division protein FtsW